MFTQTSEKAQIVNTKIQPIQKREKPSTSGDVTKRRKASDSDEEPAKKMRRQDLNKSICSDEVSWNIYQFRFRY